MTFRIKDLEADACSVVNGSFYYQVNSSGSWNLIADGDITGTKTGLSSAVDYSGALHTLVWDNSKEYIDDAVSANVQLRFKVNDSALDSNYGVSPLGFNVDNLDPTALDTTEVSMRPNAGDATVTLDGSFAEINPNTNTFYLAMNGGAYGSGSAGDTNTCTPSAHATPTSETLDGNDYVSKVKIDHVDDFGNSGSNENLTPGSNGVKPYTPPAPTVNNATATTVDVTVNKNASEATGLTYAISTEGQYVQADGSLGGSPVWQTIAAWGTKTVTGLSAPVSDYVFQTKSRNPNGDNPESDLSGGASSANSAPILHNGTAENILVVPLQATDRSGDITIRFRIKDLDLDACSIVNNSFFYQVNGGGWNPILDADIVGGKSGLSSAADLNGPLHTLIWDTSKEYINDAYSTNVQVKFLINDGAVNSVDGISPAGFNVDNLNPAVLTVTDISTQPNAGSTSVMLDSSFTEHNPNTNTFYSGVNGGDYGAGTAGDTGTADPSPQAVAAGTTLDGNDYVSKVNCIHVDDFGNPGDNENLSPNSSRKYVKPYTPAVPSVSNATASTVDVRINKNPSETPGLEYAVYISSHNKYVQSDGALGDAPAWQTIADWGTVTVTGLSGDISNYYFKTKSRNTSDAAHQSSSESNLSDGANTTGVPATPEAIASYCPAAGAENVSPEVVVRICFDRDMDAASVQAAFTMEAIYDNAGGAVSVPVSGSFNWTANRDLYFTPASSLSKGYTYRVSLSGTIQDYDGSDLTIDLSWSFRIRLDRQIQNIFFSRDGRVRVELSEGAITNDGSVDINRDPVDHPKEVNPASIAAANSKVLAEGDPFFFPIEFFISEINAYNINDIRITSTFDAPVTATMFYDDENNDGYVDGTSPRILERGLKIYRLDETNGLWVRMPGSSVDVTANCVSVTVPHFSVYTLMAFPFEDLSEAFVFPNPFKPSEGHTQMTFASLSSACTIKIFNLSGDLVKTIVEDDGDGYTTWDVKNQAGEELASGLYFYVIKSDTETRKGKFIVIR